MELAVSRFIGNFLLALSVGLCLLPWLSGRASARPLLACAAALALGRFLAGLWTLWTTAEAVIPGRSHSASEIWDFVLTTHIGNASLVASGTVLVYAFVALYAALRQGRSGEKTIAPLVMGGFALAVTPLAGHVLGDELPFYARAGLILHVLAALLWFGGLWAVTGWMRSVGRDDPARAMLIARRFSRLAQTVMAIVIGTGVALAIENIGDWPRLFATSYGIGVLLKVAMLAGVLLIASRLIVELRAAAKGDGLKPRLYVRWALPEACLATGIVLLATWIATRAPALHVTEVVWPLPFRLSYAATQTGGWDPWAVSAALMLIPAVTAWFLPIGRSARLLLTGAAACASVALAIVSLSVPANPDSYRRSTVAYSTASIGRGHRLFLENCSSCHGPLGHGDGPLAGSLPKPPANLTASHATDHTVGDIFHWITHGFGTAMPSFPFLDEESKWDLINFLRILSATYPSRLIEDTTFGQWLVAPDLDLVGRGGEPTRLSDLRGKPVIVSFVPCRSASSSGSALEIPGTITAPSLEAIHVLVNTGPCPSGEQPGRAVAPPDREAAITAFALLNRSFRRPFSMDIEEVHFLIDRSGFIRLRLDSLHDDKVSLLKNMIRRVSQEPVVPIATDHFH